MDLASLLDKSDFNTNLVGTLFGSSGFLVGGVITSRARVLH